MVEKISVKTGVRGLFDFDSVHIVLFSGLIVFAGVFCDSRKNIYSLSLIYSYHQWV